MSYNVINTLQDIGNAAKELIDFETEYNFSISDLPTLLSRDTLIISDPVLDKMYEGQEIDFTTEVEVYNSLFGYPYLRNITFNQSTQIPSGCFSRTEVKNFTGPKVTMVQSEAFYDTNNLISAHFSNNVVFKNGAFQNSNIEKVFLMGDTPSIEIYDRVFLKTSNFKGFYNEAGERLSKVISRIGANSLYNSTFDTYNLFQDSCYFAGSRALSGNTGTLVVNLQEATLDGTFIFSDMPNLETVSIKKNTSFYLDNTFSNCGKLKEVYLSNFLDNPNLNITKNFYNDTKLEKLVFSTSENSSDSWIEDLSSCINLKILIIDIPNIIPLKNVNLLSNTKISENLGIIYVPEEFVNDYKEATNWSYYSNQIQPITEEMRSDFYGDPTRI